MHLDSDGFLAVVGHVELRVRALADGTAQHNTVHGWGALSHPPQDEDADVSAALVMQGQLSLWRDGKS